MWPKRDGICLDCRSVVAEQCPAGAHRVQRIADADGREALISEVWGPKPMRVRALQAARAGAIGSGVSLFDGCGGCDFVDGETAGKLFVVFIVVAVLWFTVRLVIDVLRRRKRKLSANGARRHGLQIGPATGRIGTIVSNEIAKPPIGDRACVAYSTQLAQRHMMMLRDAATLGFEVLLDSGERVCVPAGACVIDMTGAARVAAVDGYLRAIDPLRVDGEDFDPFPHDRAVGRILVPGDRVEVLGRLIPTADGAAGGGYRELAHTVLIPDELPRLRLVNESGRAGR